MTCDVSYALLPDIKKTGWMWDLEEKLAILIISSLQIMTDSSRLENKPAVWLVGWTEITWSRNKYLLEEENHLVYSVGKYFTCQRLKIGIRFSNIWSRKKMRITKPWTIFTHSLYFSQGNLNLFLEWYSYLVSRASIRKPTPSVLFRAGVKTCPFYLLALSEHIWIYSKCLVTN